MSKNQQLREHAKNVGVKLWEIGDRLGMTDYQFSKLLRHELDGPTSKRAFDAIEAIRAEHQEEIDKC